MSMKKSLTLLLVGAALIFATPANAQKKAAGLHLPERQLTDEQQKGKEAAQQHFYVTQNSTTPVFDKKFERTPIKNLEKRDFASEMKTTSSVTPLKAPRTSTTETFYSPKEFKFVTDDDFNLFSVIDANLDGITWKHSGTYAQYGYSSSLQADDWLISPGLNLVAGKMYNIKVTASVRSAGYPERFEVKYGNAATVAGMTTTVIESTDINSTAAMTYEGLIQPSESGVFYIGVHGISDPDEWFLYIHSVAIEDGPATTTPAAVEDLTITPDATGAATATITCTAPTVDIEGEPLTSLTGVKVYRNSEELADVTRVSMGETFTFLDEDIEGVPGMVNYAVIFYNADGDGAAAQQETWIGLDAPTAVVNPVLTDNETNLTLTWEPSEAVHGGVFFPEEVLYGINIPYAPYADWGIYDYYYPDLEDGLLDVVQGESTWTIKVNTNVGEQGELALAVYAQNAAGYGWDYYDCLSNSVLLGAPYALPWNESFANSQFHGYWTTEDSETTTYNAGIYTAEGSDEDNVAVGFVAQYDLLSLKSGKITLAGATKPALLFKTKNWDTAAFPGQFQVRAITPDGQESVLEAIDYSAAEEISNEWTLHTIDLTSLASEKYIRIAFDFMVLDDSENPEYHEMDIDNINILDYFDINAKIAAAATEEVIRGEEAAIAVKITNNGATPINKYRVKVTVGDEEVANYTLVETLNTLDSKNLAFTYDVSGLEEASLLVVKAEVEVDGDGDTSDNTDIRTIAILEKEVNPVQNLAVATTETARTLTWEAPIVPEPGVSEFTEDFENGDGGFTAIDADGDGYNWNIMNNANTKPHSGIANFTSASYQGGALTPDNWLVTPAATLDGTFKFWACAQDASWSAEHFQVYASTESATDVNTFSPVSEEMIVTGEYVEYTADLSSFAGADGWVAIRHFNCTDMFRLNVDDVTFLKFQAGGADVDRYLVFRNGNVIAETKSLTFTDTDELADGEYTYQVVAAYVDGSMSDPVAVTVIIQTDGIATVISNGEKFDVYTINGMKVREGANTLKGLQKGVYVVNGKKVTIK